MPLLSSCGGIFCVNYVIVMLQHKSVHGCFVFCLLFHCCCIPLLFHLLCSDDVLGSSALQPQTHSDSNHGRTVDKWSCSYSNRLTARFRFAARALMSNNMKYKKFITIMQAALGVAPLNKRELIPPPRKLWKHSQWVVDVVVIVF